MKKISKMQIAIWALALLPVLAVAAFYQRLPAQVPMHWDFGGAVGFEDKWQLWLISGMAPLLAVVFYFLPRFDPKKRNYGKFFGSYLGFQLIMMLFLLMMTGICIVEGLHPGTLDIAMVVCLAVSLLLIYLGNIMPKFRMNWNCGIKNPWTLSSETVWTRTHRLAGRLFFAAGCLGAISAFIPNTVARFVVFFGLLLVAVLVPTVCSYVWFRTEQTT